MLPPQFHADELRFVENGCHDNPTLDVASDGQHEMQKKKKPDSNGLPGEGAGAREEATHWQVAGTTEEPINGNRSFGPNSTLNLGLALLMTGVRQPGCG